MPGHDIIANLRQKMGEPINRVPPSTEAARFDVGYFFRA